MTAVIREVLAMSNNNVSGQTLTSSSGVAGGDTFVVIQATDNNTLTAATSSAGTLVQVGTDSLNDAGNGILRVLTCNAGSGGAQTVTFPVAGGFDLYGAVLIMTGTVTVEGFNKGNDSSSVTSHTTPASASLAGAADLLVSAGLHILSSATWDISLSGLTQQAQVTTAFGAFYTGTATLASTGASPTYTVTTSGSTKGQFVTIGLDDGGGGGGGGTQRPRTQIVGPSLAATQRASW